jgi:hypothetical protein
VIARCDLTDLLVDQCAHCLKHTDTAVIDAGTVVVGHTRLARFDGRCAIDARHGIDVGDRIGQTEHGWVCSSCTAVGLAP